MEKKSGDFSMQEVMRLASSPAGKQLIAMLQQAKSGDYSNAGQTLSGMLSTPEAQKLLRELGGK